MTLDLPDDNERFWGPKVRAALEELDARSIPGDLPARATSLETRATTVEGRATALEGRASDLEAMSIILGNETDTLAGRATALETRATNVEGQASALDVRADQLEASTASLDARATTLENQRVTLSGQTAALDTRATTLEGRAGLLESRATALEGQATALDTRADALETRATNLETDVADFQGRAAAVESRATSLETRATNLEADVAEFEGRAAAVESRATSLETRATTVEGRATALEGRATALETDVADLGAETSSLDTRATSLETLTTTGRLSEAGLAAAAATAAAAANRAAAISEGKYEGRPLYLTGHSFIDSEGHNTLPFWERIAGRLRMRADNAIMDAIAGTRLGQHSISVLGGPTAYPINSGRTVMACCSLNWPSGVPWNASFARSHEHAWRSLIAAVSARAAVGATSANFVYSADWSKVPATQSTGGAIWTTTTPGEYAEFTYTESGTGCDVFLRAATDGAGLVTFTEGATVLGTLDLSQPFYDACSAIFRIRGLANGPHTIRATLTTGRSLTLDGYRIPSELPPPVVVFLEGGVNAAFDAEHPYQNANLDIARGITEAVCAEFSNVAVADSRPEWDNETMTYEGIHPNDEGSAVFTAKGIEAMYELDWLKGGQILDSAWPPVYTPPAAPATPAGGWSGTGAGGSVRINHIPQPSFEGIADATFTHAAGAARSNEAPGLFGEKSGRVINGSSGDQYLSFGSSTNAIPVSPGEPVAFSAYARHTSGSAANPAWLTVHFWTAGGNYISTITGASAALTTETWTRLTATGVVPANAAVATPGVQYNNVGAEWRTDGWLYEKAASVGDYFDGDSPDAYWAGAAHNSPSALPL